MQRQESGLLDRREFLKKGLLTSTTVAGILRSGLTPRLLAAGPDEAGGNRVTWVHEPSAVTWRGSGYFGDDVDPSVIDRMVAAGIRELTLAPTAADGWRRLLPDYTPGRKVGIKVNVNNGGGSDAIDASAGPINGVIGGLRSMGVEESDIWVIEPSNVFSDRIAGPVLARYPRVLFWDATGSRGHAVTYDSSDSASTTIHYSHPALASDPSYLPEQFGDLHALINMPIMKGHGGAEVSLGFKNLIGATRRYTISKLHPYFLPWRSSYSYDRNPLMDIYANPNLGDKIVLTVGDGLFCSRRETAARPEVWNTFDGQYPSSLFFATDAVALDSVLFDFLDAEAARPERAQQYLHRAAELGYGAHDHWNNSRDKQYERVDLREVGIEEEDPEPDLPPAPPANVRIEL